MEINKELEPDYFLETLVSLLEEYGEYISSDGKEIYVFNNNKYLVNREENTIESVEWLTS